MSHRSAESPSQRHHPGPFHASHQRDIFFGIAVALLVTVSALAGCAETSTSSVRSATTPKITATPTIPATTAGFLTQRAQKAVGTAARQVEVTYQETDRTAVVNITLVWSPGWKSDFALAQAAAKLACYQSQAALWTSGMPLSKVTVIVLGQALDDYSSVITSAYAAVDLTAQHASDIVWSATNADQAWARYDHTFLRPTYAPNWLYLPQSH
jgi:hypothetical protein